MVTKIPEELMDKLKIIEEEASFFLKVPRKPSRNHLISLIVGGPVIFLFVLLTLYSDSESGYLSLVLITVMYALHIIGYVYQKNLCDQYSKACKIINLYKNVYVNTET